MSPSSPCRTFATSSSFLAVAPVLASRAALGFLNVVIHRLPLMLERQWRIDSAQTLDLKIEPEWVPIIRTHLQVTLRLGGLVAAFALPDEAEPAPVFEA